ncbi:MAG: hypothetical protein U0T81_19945 [Saprospiraceae bacterium]
MVSGQSSEENEENWAPAREHEARWVWVPRLSEGKGPFFPGKSANFENGTGAGADVSLVSKNS